MLVLVLRHGEREDEVMSRQQREQMSASRRFDPALTPKGHQQAREAWVRISLLLDRMKPKKVAVFTSPLRRAVGTAIMISETTQENWKVSLPVDSKELGGQEIVEQKYASTEWTGNTIPIVIWNGLCDCAAQIGHSGGHRNAIETGFMSCAATQDLTPATFSESSMATTWREMMDYTRTNTSNDCSNGASSPTQFWKVSPHRWYNALVPMTPKLHLRRGIDDPTPSSSGSTVIHKVHDERDNESEINQVVHHALLTGCDVCIIVSHREEIRDLCTICFQKPHSRMHLPYCCVGIFSVSMEMSNGVTGLSQLDWRCHDVTAYQNLSEDFVEKLLT